MTTYTLQKDDWKDHIDDLALIACEGDIIMVPNIRAMNIVMRKLIEMKPNTIIYVRLSEYKYWPKIGSDIEVSL